jgi:hypothetical protein
MYYRQWEKRRESQTGDAAVGMNDPLDEIKDAFRAIRREKRSKTSGAMSSKARTVGSTSRTICDSDFQHIIKFKLANNWTSRKPKPTQTKKQNKKTSEDQLMWEHTCCRKSLDSAFRDEPQTRRRSPLRRPAVQFVR